MENDPALERARRRIVNHGVRVVVIQRLVRLLPRDVAGKSAFLLKLTALLAVRFERRPTHIRSSCGSDANVATSRGVPSRFDPYK
jgi:hypothetical protein